MKATKPAIVLAFLSVLSAAPGYAKKAKPAPCPGGRFVLESPVSTPLGTVDAVVVSGGEVRLPGCAAAAGRIKAGKRGTKVGARWQACAAFTGRVTLKAKIIPGCDALYGVLSLGKKSRTRLSGRLSRCGDGVLDVGGGEQCDPTGCAGGETCDTASCSCTLPGSTTYDVTYTEGTAVIDPAVVSGLFRRKEEARFVFDAAAEAVRALVPGQVVLFGGLALRRVVTVAQVGDELVVDTEPARLTDAIADGTIGWQSTVRFDAASVARAVALQGRGVPIGPSDGSMTLVAVSDGAEFGGTIAGVDVTLKLTPATDRLNVEMELGYEPVAGFSGFSAKATGWIRGFDTLGQIIVERRQLRRLSLETLGVSGELTLEIAAVRLSTDGFKLPLPLVFPIPLMVGPIPVLLNVRANATVVPVLDGEGSSDLRFKLTFDADQGVRVSDGTVTPAGQLRNEGFSLERAETAGFVPVGLGFGLEFPRIELSMLGNVIVPYATLVTSVRSYFTPIIVAPCQDAGGTIRGVIGYDFEFLGLEQSAERELFKKEKFTRRDSGGVADGGCP